MREQQREWSNMSRVVRTNRKTHPENLSQMDVSEILGYRSCQFISNVERGLCGIPARSMPKLAEVLSVELDTLHEAAVEDYKAYLRSFKLEGGL